MVFVPPWTDCADLFPHETARKSWPTTTTAQNQRIMSFKMRCHAFDVNRKPGFRVIRAWSAVYFLRHDAIELERVADVGAGGSGNDTRGVARSAAGTSGETAHHLGAATEPRAAN